jgi:NTE family protein
MSEAPKTGRVGLACAGGVVEGAFYEIGVLCALEEAVEGLDLNALDIYVGVSAGAVIAACLANGVRPRTLAREMTSPRGPIRLAPEQVFTPAYRQYLNRVGMVPWTAARAVKRCLANPAELSVTGAVAELAPLLPCGIFENSPLERQLARFLGEEGHTNDFRELRRELRVIAVNLDTSELVAFGEPGLDHVPISRAVQASTALPLLYCPVEIEGVHYIDGVAQRTLNASQALSAGAELVFCINPIVPIDLRVADDPERDRGLVRMGLPGVLSQTFRTIIHSRLVAGLRVYEYTYPDADVILIEPQPGDRSMFFTNVFSFANRSAVIRHGYLTARGFLAREAGQLGPRLTRHGLRLRVEALTGPPTTGDWLGDDGPATGSAPVGRNRRALGGVLAQTGAALEELESALLQLDARVG